MFVNSKKIAKAIEEKYPKQLAASWDNVGFQIGNGNTEVDRILVTLEVTPEVVDEAIERNIDLIISHHPLIFKPLKAIVEDDPIGAMIRKLLLHKINLYVAHTNLDAGIGGTGDYLAKRLELQEIQPLFNEVVIPYQKLVTYVPKEFEDAVREAIAHAGAGSIGHYSDCSFASEGIGRFKPLANSNAFIGKLGELEAVHETRLEAIMPANLSGAVIEALVKAHPYETPAYTVSTLDNVIEAYSYAKRGMLQTALTLSTLAKSVSELLGCESIKVVGTPEELVRKVAVCTGSGADYLVKASQANCDVIITGDLKYHEAQLAKQLNLKVIDAGHFETEVFFVQSLKVQLEELFDQKGYECRVIASESLKNPFKYICK